MDIGKGISRSFDVYTKNFLTLFLAALVVLAVCGIGFAVLYWLFVGVLGFGFHVLSTIFLLVPLIAVSCFAGPLVGGFFALARKLLAGQKADLNEVFAHFDKLVPTGIILSVLALLWFVVSIIGDIPVLGGLVHLAFSILSPGLALVFFVAVGLAVEKGLAPFDAIKRAAGCFLANPIMLWVYALIVIIMSVLGSVLGWIPIAILTAIFGIFGVFLGVFLWLLFGIPCLALTVPFGVVGLTAAYGELETVQPKQVKLERQAVQIAVLVTVALFLLGLVFRFTGWGWGLRWWTVPAFRPFGRLGSYNWSWSERRAERAAEDLLSKATGQKVKVSKGGKKVKIQSDEGTFSVGEGLPDDFPRDVPVYPRAKVGGYMASNDGDSNGFVATLTTGAGVDEVFQYYCDQLDADGWTLVGKFDFGTSKTVGFEKPERKGTVSISRSEGAAETIVVLTLGKE